MSILSQKQQVFGNIASFRTLTEGLPQLKITSSLGSINNNGDTVTFLCDLIKSLIGYEALQQTITDTLVYALADIEKEIKLALKQELKSIVSCGVDPSLPDFLKSTGSGITFPVSKIDFTNLMMVDPTSDAGKLLYTDLTPNLIDSKDFNAFLYQTIQNDGNIEGWGHATAGLDILDISFKSVDVSAINPNNSLTITSSPTYDTRTLTQFNNDYIDSISLFNAQNLITNIIDIVFGSVSTMLNKSLTQLQNEAQVNSVIDRISKSDSNDIISDKYFSFSNEENLAQQQSARLRKNGISTLNTSSSISTNVPFTSVQSLSNNIQATTNQIDKKSVISDSLNQIGGQIAQANSNPQDNQAVKLNFIQSLIDNLIMAIVNSVLSPKVVTIFMINYKIVYGPDATFTDAVDFLKKNKNLIHNITKKISGMIIKILLNIALKEIATLVAAGIVVQQIDKAESNLTQLLSLIGIPQDVLRQIKGLL